MTISTAITDSFKVEMLSGLQDVTSDTFKIALYSPTASLDYTTTAYTSVGECIGSNYTAGGIVLSGASIWIDGTTVGIDFNDAVFLNITIPEIRGFLIYNQTRSNASVVVKDFGQSFQTIASNFTIEFPAPTAATGLIRFA
jgi:hypothetical protein